MRPALDGHAGIPQETRLLFRGLGTLDGVEVEGLIQSHTKLLAKGLPPNGSKQLQRMSTDRRINRLSRVVVTLSGGGRRKVGDWLTEALQMVWAAPKLIISNLLGIEQQLLGFDATNFKDFVWRSLFARTLPLEDFEAVTQSRFRVVRMPWQTMHGCALATRRLGHALYPRLNTRGLDVMIAETPYPGSVSPGTTLVVRYHDAIPILMPHTISARASHQAAHYNALRKNVDSGAHFACVSDATRHDLLSIFPQAAPRAVTIPNMISKHFFAEESSPLRVPEIIHTRRNAAITLDAGAPVPPLVFGGGQPEYLLMVSTIEPRKNHLTLLSAWEQLRTELFPNLQLVLVGMLGWDHVAIVKKFRPWLARGGLHVLEDVPAPELRLLYRHARVTVCPSFGEGFDFSGVEAMRCGGVVAASELPVHREVFGDAAEYFSPYSIEQVADVLAGLLGPGANAAARRAALASAGDVVSARYLPERVLPQWQTFLDSLQADSAPR